jgi:DNA polymerase-3 subunit delta
MYYLFHGPDTHRQRLALADLLAGQGDADLLALNTTRFHGPMPFADFQQACSAVPFLAPVRVVIAEELFAASLDKTFLDKLEAFLPDLPEKTVLVFLQSSKLADSHRIIKLAGKDRRAKVELFDELKGPDLERWIRERVKTAGGRLTPRATNALALNVGSDLQALGNEIEKLVLYKGPGAEIDFDDVVVLSPYAAEARIFDLTDALGERRGAAAAEAFQRQLQQGADPFQIFAMIVRQFRLLIQAKEVSEGGGRQADIAKALGVHPFVAEKLSRQVKGYTMSQLEQIYARLLAIDVDVKTGRADLLTSLHVLVAGLAGETTAERSLTAE